MRTTVGAIVPENGLAIAAAILGIPDPSQTDAVAAALALYHGMSPEQARSRVLARRRRPSSLGSQGPKQVSARVDADLADVGDANRSFAIRVGLGLSAGLDREQAEQWARMPVGRPRLTETD
jgi:hypothetical protein